MVESTIDRSISWVQAFVMALYSALIAMLSIGVLGSKYLDIISMYNDLANSYALYVAWASYGLLLISALLLIIMGFSLGFNRYDVALGSLGLAFLLTGLFDLSYIGILYLIGSELGGSIYIPGACGLLKLIAGFLAIKFSRSMEEANFIPLVTIIFLVPLIYGLAVFFNPTYTAADIFEMIWDYVFGVVTYSANDIVYLSLGGYLAPLSILAALISLMVARRAGSFTSSFGAKISITFGVFTGILGLSISGLSGIAGIAEGILMYNIGAEQVVVTHYLEALNFATFIALTILAFYALANYYVVAPVTRPTRRERPIEETVEEATVTAKEEKKKEEGEEIIEGLEELEFDEFEDLDEF